MLNPSVPAASRPRPWLAGGALFLLALTCYAPALQGTFLWDDLGHVTRADLRPLSGLVRIWFERGSTQQYYPLLHSVFWFEYQLWGDAPLGYHLLNVAWHALAACLAATLLKQLAVPGAWLAATLFVVHPVGVESVAWISEQKNTLSLVFYLAAALAYVRFDETRRLAAFAAALGLFAAALLTKSVTATLPATLLVILWWKRGRLGWKRDALPLVPWFVAGTGYGLYTAWIERRLIGAVGAEYALSAGQRCLLAGRAIWFYLGKLVDPVDLSFVYLRWDVAAAGSRWALFLAAAVGVTAALWLLRKRTRGPLAAWLIYAGSLFPALGFFNVYPFRFSYVADHFQYLASLAIIALAAAAVTSGLNRLPLGSRRIARSLCVLLVALLGFLTLRQSRLYRDPGSLYRATVAHNPSSWLAQNNLGAVLANQGSLSEAIDHFQAAIRLKPDYAEAFVNWGDTLAQTGRIPEAIERYETALRLDPNDIEGHANLAVLLASQGRQTEAIHHDEIALRLNPEFAPAHFNLANALSTEGHYPEAIGRYEESLRINPDYSEAAMGSGNALLQENRVAEAIVRFTDAVRLKPDLADGHNNLGVALSRQGRWQEAIAQYREALLLRPKYSIAQANLDRALAQAHP